MYCLFLHVLVLAERKKYPSVPSFGSLPCPFISSFITAALFTLPAPFPQYQLLASQQHHMSQIVAPTFRQLLIPHSFQIPCIIVNQSTDVILLWYIFCIFYMYIILCKSTPLPFLKGTQKQHIYTVSLTHCPGVIYYLVRRDQKRKKSTIICL